MLPRSPAPSEWDERPTHVSRVGHLGSARSAAQFCRAAVLGWFQYCSARPQTVGNEGLGNTTGLRYFLLRPEGLEIGTDSAEAIFCSSIRAPRGKFVINIHFVEPRPNPRRTRIGKAVPTHGSHLDHGAGGGIATASRHEALCAHESKPRRRHVALLRDLLMIPMPYPRAPFRR